jgi:hypothetical protein
LQIRISFTIRGSTVATRVRTTGWQESKQTFDQFGSLGHVELKARVIQRRYMKVRWIAVGVGLVFSLTVWPAFSQASFIFANYVASVGLDAPVFDADGNRLSGTNYVAVLYGGPTPDSLQPAKVGNSDMVPVPFAYMPNGQAGYFGRGGGVEVENVPCGGTPWLQIVAWDARLGASYEDVAALGIGGYGESNLFQKRGGNPCGLPTPHEPLLGLESFSLHPVPEPSTWALLGLGVGFLFWRWRRRE